MQAEIVVVKGEDRGTFVQIREVVTIGRSERADLTLEDTKASSLHAKLTPLESGVVILEDLGSTNGTFVNKERIEQTPLRSGDLIKIGRSLIVFRDEPAQVRLEDIALIEGGSSSALRRKESKPAATTSSAALRAVRQAAGARPLTRLETMLEVSGELSAQRAADGILEELRVAAAADRALLFLRNPVMGGLGLANSAIGEGALREAPVQADVLRKAAEGEVSSQGAAVAVPVFSMGRPLGAVYVDGSEEMDRDLPTMCAGAQLIGLVSGLDRTQRLVLATTEIVALAQETTDLQPVELQSVVNTRDRARQSMRYAPQPNRQPLETAIMPGLWVRADRALLARGLDRLIEYARGEARGPLRLVGEQRENTVRLLLRFAVKEAPPDELLDAGGVVADLLRARDRFDTGELAVARVAVLRAGARLTVELEGGDLVFLLELAGASPPDPSEADTRAE